MTMDVILKGQKDIFILAGLENLPFKHFSLYVYKFGASIVQTPPLLCECSHGYFGKTLTWLDLLS